MGADDGSLTGGPGLRLNLAGARQKRGITLEEIAQSTKITSRLLQAIEVENFHELPGGIYNTSYLRQYASAIGYDESVLLRYYHAQTEPDQMIEIAPSQSRFARSYSQAGEALRTFLAHFAAWRRKPTRHLAATPYSVPPKPVH